MRKTEQGPTIGPWSSLQHPVVRDLAWAVFSEPLLLSEELGSPGVSNCRLDCTDARRAWLQHLDRRPGALLASLQPSSKRLGLYFEALWHFFLSEDPGCRLLGHNLPVRARGRTFGEFDILYECIDSGRQVHLELAVKFYLGVPGTDIWLGPGQRDRLQQKCDHLLYRQIRLAAAPEASEVLAAHGVNEPEALSREIEVKGYLFRAADNRLPCSLPSGHNPRSASGRWLTLAEFEGEPPAAWTLLEKKRWLSPLDGHPGEPASAVAAQLRDAFSAGRGPQLTVRCDAQGEELERVFVTAPTWPDRV